MERKIIISLVSGYLVSMLPIWTIDSRMQEQEFAESKSSGDNGAAYYPPKQTPPPAPADSADGFMNIPDGIEEELPFS